MPVTVEVVGGLLDVVVSVVVEGEVEELDMVDG